MLNPKTEVHPMLWNHFEADRAALGKQYTEEHWDEDSGLSPEALRTELLAIERTMAGQPAIAVKTRLYEKVLASAQLDVDRRDFFPEKLHHDFLLSRIRGRWMKDFRAREMAGLLAETDAATKGLCYTGDADFGHTSPDWEAVLTLGIPGLRARVLAARDEKTTLTEAQRLFYACMADTLLETFMARRGFAMQINVLSPAVLRAAQANPEKYATLQVRLCGWNVYFTALSRVEQDEFIRRTENAANA